MNVFHLTSCHYQIFAGTQKGKSDNVIVLHFSFLNKKCNYFADYMPQSIAIL